MPIRTRATARLRLPLAELPGLLRGAAFYALAELGLALLLGFFRLGRAEALLFLAVRPWLLIVAAAAVARRPLRSRAIFYGSALLLAASSESIFLLGLGADNPWPEAGRGLIAGAMVAIVADAAIQIGRRMLPRFGALLGALALAALLLLPGALRPYESIVLGSGDSQAAERHDLMLMSALPLEWGEAGPLDPSSRPAAAYRMLAKEFAIRPLDVLEDASLASGRLLLLAQPRALAPAELVAVDAWVRRGGKALILTDPALTWPSELPLGDIRRPPAIGLLGPLLTHWGLDLVPPEHRAAVIKPSGPQERRLAMFAPGRFVKTGGSCAVERQGHIARCSVGKGKAILVADADMMHDRLWVGPGADGAERHARISDNPLLIADWLDELQGSERQRAAPPVQWIASDQDPLTALFLALLPLLAAASMFVARAVARRR
jgi:hypothetical protein